MNIKIFIKIFIALISIILLNKYNFLDFSYLLKLDIYLSIKIIGIVFLIMILGSIKWYFLIIIQNNNISFKQVLESYYLGYALNYVLFGIAGDIIKTIYLIKGKKNKIGISMSVVIDRLIGLFSMFLLIVICFPKIIEYSSDFSNFNTPIADNLFKYYSIVFLSFFFLCILIKKILNSRRINKIIFLYFYRYKNNTFRIISKTIKVLFSYRKSSLYLLYNLISAMLLQIIIAFSIFIICTYVINFEISYFNNLVSSLIVQIISIVPLSPGNIGVGEAAFSQIMYILNNNILLQYATVYFIFRIFNMLCSIPGVIIYYLVIRKRVY